MISLPGTSTRDIECSGWAGVLSGCQLNIHLLFFESVWGKKIRTPPILYLYPAASQESTVYRYYDYRYYDSRLTISSRPLHSNPLNTARLATANRCQAFQPFTSAGRYRDLQGWSMFAFAAWTPSLLSAGREESEKGTDTSHTPDGDLLFVEYRVRINRFD